MKVLPTLSPSAPPAPPAPARTSVWQASAPRSPRTTSHVLMLLALQAAGIISPPQPPRDQVATVLDRTRTSTGRVHGRTRDLRPCSRLRDRRRLEVANGVPVSAPRPSTTKESTMK